MKYVLTFIGLGILSYFAYVSMAGANTAILDETIAYNNRVYDKCFSNRKGEATASGQISGSGNSKRVTTDTDKYRQATDCWKSQRKLTPDDLYLTVPKYLVDEGKCAISQGEDDHVSKGRGGMYATDLACKFEGQGVYAPDYLDQMVDYTIEEAGADTLLGNFVLLKFPSSYGDVRWYFGHTVLDKKWKVGDTIRTGVRFAYADLSGATTGWHTHIELRRSIESVWQSVRYVTRYKERELETKRMGAKKGTPIIPVVNAAEDNTSGHQFKLTDTFYFTHYGLGDVNQNDGDPCISADGKDSCELQKKGIHTMALTVDIRNALGIKLGDKARLEGDEGCRGEYIVTDEMACRFRGVNAWSNGPCYYSRKKASDPWIPTPKNSNIKRPGTNYYIKGDLPGKAGGACSVKKL